jgi:DNA-binding LacI/PurR family transcriptional regulator
MTLSKLAKLAHVSVSTASKAFSMSPEINEETRRAIFQIARELGCFKKFYNGKYPRYVVAVLCPELKSLHYARAMALLQEELSRRNCELCVATTDFDPSTTCKLLDYYDKYSKVDAIILFEKGEERFDCELPVVVVENVELFPAMQAAIDHFRAGGAESIGFIGEPHTLKKQQYFEQAMGAELDPRYVSIAEERFEAGGYQAMEQLFEQGNVPRALLCAYDYMAIGAMRCIADHGLRIPEDVAVIGMDDLPEAAYLSPSLSSINCDAEAVCKAAAEQVLFLLSGDTPSPAAGSATLRLRESSAFN